jgi:hypothetical protein
MTKSKYDKAIVRGKTFMKMFKKRKDVRYAVEKVGRSERLFALP